MFPPPLVRDARIHAVRRVAPCTRRLRTLDILVESADITPSKAKGLNTYFDKFNAVVFLTVWVKILHRIEKRDLILQSSSTRL